MSIDIVFDNSDLEDNEGDDIDDDDIDDDIEDESSSSSEEDEDKESVSFESDPEDGLDGDDDVDLASDGEESGIIDLAEFYDETPKKKTAKAIFNKRKRSKPPKVAKAKRIKKKKGGDIVILNYLIDDVREKTIVCLTKFTIEKNAKIVERSIYNHTIRKEAILLGRPVKKTDLSKDSFKKNYTMISYEIISSISKGVKCKESISNLDQNKTSLQGESFRNEQFNDSQETSNIENPPKVMRGIHTCSVCIKDKDRINDPDRGKRVDWYQQQTRSCDEPMTSFMRCTDCGKKWKC